MTLPLRPVSLLVLAALVVGACGVGATPLPTIPAATPTEAAGASGSGCPTSPPAALPAGETRTVVIATAKGSITIKVEADLGPLAAGNFVALAECGFYDGVVFHRLMPGFVIQGGDPTGTGSGGPGYEFPNDPVNVPYDRGRRGDGQRRRRHERLAVLHRPRRRRPVDPTTRSSAG